MQQSRRILTPLVLSLTLAACTRTEVAPEPERAVRTTVVAASQAATTLEFAGDVRARSESRLAFRVPGKLVARAVNLGDAVKAGQSLARLDSRDLALGQASADAAVTAARVNRDQAALDYKRFVDLHKQGFISAAELERREAAMKTAQAQFDQARAAADVQGNQASYGQLLADISGVVTGVDAEPGMVLAAGQPVVRVAADGPRDVVFSVPEDKVEALRAAAARSGSLKLKLWGRSDTHPLTLREVSAAADPVTRTFLFKADVGKLDVRLGQSATVLLDLPQQAGVIKLPLPAVAQQSGKSMVWLLDPASMTVKPLPVQVSGAEGNSAVIAAGLAAGQEIVVAGVHVLSPGQKVKRYQAPRGPAPAVEPSPVGVR